MSNKIQMTEEQARRMIDECVCTNYSDLRMNATIKAMKEKGYIIKPEIEQKIEEVENEFNKFKEYYIIYDKTGTHVYNELKLIIDNQHNLIQLLNPYYYNSKEGN